MYITLATCYSYITEYLTTTEMNTISSFYNSTQLKKNKIKYNK